MSDCDSESYGFKSYYLPKINNLINFNITNKYIFQNYILVPIYKKNLKSKIENFYQNFICVSKIKFNQLIFFFFNVFFFFNSKKFKFLNFFFFLPIFGFNLRTLNYKFFSIKNKYYNKISLKSFFAQQNKLQKNVENNYKSSKFLKLFFIFTLKSNLKQFSKILLYLKYYSFTFLFSFYSILKIISKFLILQLFVWNFKKGNFKFFKKIKSIKKRLKKNNSKNFKMY